MILYHGSLAQIPSPEIRKRSHTLDYGEGFYTTSSYDQAKAWVKRKLQNSSQPLGYINKYELNTAALDSLKCLHFKEPSEEWLDFVMKNRTDINFHHDFDVVSGPVANDRVYAAFALYEGGVLSKANLISELKTYKLIDQYLFHTPRSLQAISFVGSEQIKI